MRVLMVEDNKDTLATQAAVLRFEKFDVTTAMDGPTALEMARASPPDVVLLDIGLPGLDGYRLAQALREQSFGKKLYLVAITGYSTAQDKALAAGAGIDLHLAKPADPMIVIHLLRALETRVRAAARET